MTNTQSITTIDARGLKCPLPVLKLEKALANAKPGTLIVLADDPVARVDIPVLCRKHELQCMVTQADNALQFEIQITA